MANFGSNHSGMTLKALLEDPNLQNPPLLQKGGKNTDKNGQGSQQFDFGSAFLGPTLWDKTYNDPDFNLEYMDLDEFLQENGIPLGDDELGALTGNDVKLQCSSPPLHTPVASPQQLSPKPIQLPPSPPMVTSSSSPGPSSPSGSRASPAPTSPATPEVPFAINPQDLHLVTIPGQESFDPRKRVFTDEELKPQPVIKKSKKVFVNEDRKDDKYWARRNKNNTAAKRSRDARRLKENQIAMRAAFLEKENAIMRSEMERLKKENSNLKTRLSKYESSSSSN